MVGRSSLVAGAEQEAALRKLAASPVRGEADRARAVLLTLSGWTAAEIGEAFGVGEDAVRRWRAWFARGGADTLRSTLAPGPSPARGERALAAARAILAEPVQDRPNWTLPRLRAEVEARTGVRLSLSHLSVLLRRGFRWRRTRHTLTGRQDTAEVARVGLRLQLRRAQAAAGDVVLLFGDESEALTHPYLAHAWAERGADLRVQAPGQARKVAMLGVLDAITRRALVHTSPTKRSADFAVLLERLDRAYGPALGQARRPVVLVLDNGPIHTSKATAKALAARPWLAVEWLPRYAPELNPIEGTWRDLKRHHLAHRTFRNADDLDRAIHQAVAEMNQERSVMHPCHNLPRAA